MFKKVIIILISTRIKTWKVYVKKDIVSIQNNIIVFYIFKYYRVIIINDSRVSTQQ